MSATDQTERRAPARSRLVFDLPRELEATAPSARRDAVRMLVARPSGLRHAHFRDLAGFLQPGDLVVVNTSATLAAAVDGQRVNEECASEQSTNTQAVTSTDVSVHFSTDLGDGHWVVEIRPRIDATGPLPDAAAGQRIELEGGVALELLEPYPPTDELAPRGRPNRLWRAEMTIDGGVPAYLARFGRPIRYSYVSGQFPLADYQTIFARDTGNGASAEMPSAGRPFTAEVVLDLVTRGIAIAPITLHTGVSSQDAGEPPLAERFDVPEATARTVECTRRSGGRIVAVGTTVTRALESAADAHGVVHAGSGWTHLVLGPERPAQVVTGLITGWHAPGASHLNLLRAVAGDALVEQAYLEALREHYLWHEFGDSCLLLP